MSFGLDALGARGAGDATAALPLSRAGSDASFQKLQVSGLIEQPVAKHLTLWTVARAQTAFGRAMANAEQLGVATTQGLSPLPAGAIQGDAGYVARTEARLPFAFSLPIGSGRITPYGFGAAAGVRLEKPTVVERRSTQGYAYGAGVRIAGAARDGTPGVAAGLEYGRAHVEGRTSTDRLTVNFIAQF